MIDCKIYFVYEEINKLKKLIAYLMKAKYNVISCEKRYIKSYIAL